MNFEVNLKKIGSLKEGYLSFFEENKDVPFEIKRIYYIYSAPLGIKRGNHAHKRLSQLLWCPHGKVEVILDNGIDKHSYILDSPQKALIIPKGYWRDMIWKKKDSVLCVAASDFYSEDDYIRNYNEFVKYVESGYWKDEN